MSGDIQFLGELRRMDVKPGDRFVLMIDKPMPMSMHARIREIWADFMGADKNKLLVLDSGIKIGAIASEPVDDRYLVWSNEHRAWWRAESAGYASSILHAGLYSRAVAIDIADKSRNGWSVTERPDEIAVALADIPKAIRDAVIANAEATS